MRKVLDDRLQLQEGHIETSFAPAQYEGDTERPTPLLSEGWLLRAAYEIQRPPPIDERVKPGGLGWRKWH